MGNPEGKSDRPAPESLTPLLAPLQALQNLLSAFNDRGVIIGGIAVSLLGTPRYTVDLDAVFLLTFDDLPRLLSEAAKQILIFLWAFCLLKLKWWNEAELSM